MSTGRTLSLCALIGALGSASVAAPNLVPNPSFDDPQICPSDQSQLAQCSPPWFSASTASPDTLNECSTTGTTVNMGVPQNEYGRQKRRTGTGYAGVYLFQEGPSDKREYIEVKLLSPLAAGQTYKVTFFVSLGNRSKWMVSTIGAHFSKGPVNQNNAGPMALTPQVNSNQGFLGEKRDWEEISGKFVAAGGEDHITIGNFAPKGQSPKKTKLHAPFSDYAYYYIEDVSVVCECNGAPSFTTQPRSDSVPCGQGVSFSGETLGSCVSSYRWICDDCFSTPTALSDDGVNFYGTSTATLSLTPKAVATFREKTFHLTASNDCGTGTSTGVRVTPILPPITLQPVDVTICPPEQVSFSVAGTGSDWKYQWYWAAPGGSPVKFDPSQGGNAPTLDFQAWPGLCGASVYCTLSNMCGSISSQPALIHCCDCVMPPTNMALWLPFDQIASPGVTRNVVSGYGGVLLPSGAGPSLSTNQYVGNSFFFNGITGQYVLVPHHDLVDLTTGDFTIDAWIALEGTVPNDTMIVDKRFESASSVTGYAMFIQGGANPQLVFQMADGTSASWVAPVSLLVGWHHVAVTVSRKSTTGGTMYVDRIPVLTFDPTGHKGNLSNTRPFTVGGRSTTPSNFFFGWIDEVELFRRALTQSEIAALFQANGVGKCKQFVQTYPATIYCMGGAPTTIGAYLYNFTANPATFTGSFQPFKVAPFFPYAPPNLPVFPPPVTVGAWGTNSVSTLATLPLGMPAGATATYLTPFTTGGHTTSALGTIVNRPDISCPGGGTTIVQVPLGGSAGVTLGFSNAGISSGNLAYRVQAIGPDGLASQTLSLNGGIPGEPVEGAAPAVIGTDFKVDVDARFDEVDALGLTMLVLSTDADGDGVFELAATTPLACDVPAPPTCCPADFNCDGQVDDLDFAFFAAAYDELLCPDAPETCPADFNADGFVDDLDFQVFIPGYDTLVCP